MKPGTLLHTIAKDALWIECRACGHGSVLTVEDLLSILRQDATIASLSKHLKCSKCRKRQLGEIRLATDAECEESRRSVLPQKPIE